MSSRSSVVLAVTAAMLAVATLFVFLRLVSRFAIVRRIQLDDYFIFLAWITAFGLSFSICYATKFGLGTHQKTIPPAKLVELEKLEYAFSVLYNPCLMATKTSICVFYLSLTKMRRAIKWMTIGTIVVVNVAGLALSLLNIFQCHPVTAFFTNPLPKSAQCIDILILYQTSAPVNILTDLAILLLPMPLLKGMNLPRKQKIILHITFGFGIFVTAVDVVRIGYLQKATISRLQSLNTQRTTSHTDFSWYAAYSFMWSAIEVNVGIMCACVPALKPLVTRFLPKLLKDNTTPSTEKRQSVAALNNSEPVSPVQRVNSTHVIDSPAQVHSSDGEETSGELDFLEFLTTPDANELPPVQRSETAMTNASGLSRKGTNYMEFVDMSEKKGIVYMSNRESLKPIGHVTFLFFLWGFAYGLLNTLNTQFEIVAQVSSGQSTALHSAYYAGYFCGPIFAGRLILKRRGFKACYMIGLIIYGTGTLIFWPSAVLMSFGAFFVSNFIVGFGLAILEVAANPFIALCGPPRYMEVRLNLSQGIQACGTVVSPLLAKKVLFKNIQDASSLVDVQWTYLAITLFTFFMAIVYYMVKLPEVTDEELEDASRRTNPETFDQLRTSKVIWITLGLAVFAQFLYTGAQESLATSLFPYLLRVDRTVNEINYEAIGHTLFAASRFLAGFVLIWIKPRYVLFFFFLGSVIFSIMAMHFDGTTPGVMVLMIYFFEGPLFPLIYSIPLRGLGKYTKDAAVLITAAIGGGAVFPPIQSAVKASRGVQYSYCVIAAAFAFGTIFPLYLNFWPSAKMQVDRPKHNDSVELLPSVRRPSTTQRGINSVMHRLRLPEIKEEGSRATEDNEMLQSSTL